jgi:hypothetical protein
MIPNIAAKGNTRLEVLAIPLIIVLVGLAAFGLGRLSAQQDSPKSTLIVHQEGVATTTPTSTLDY